MARAFEPVPASGVLPDVARRAKVWHEPGQGVAVDSLVGDSDRTRRPAVGQAIEGVGHAGGERLGRLNSGGGIEGSEAALDLVLTGARPWSVVTVGERRIEVEGRSGGRGDRLRRLAPPGEWAGDDGSEGNVDEQIAEVGRLGSAGVVERRVEPPPQDTLSVEGSATVSNQVNDDVRGQQDQPAVRPSGWRTARSPSGKPTATPANSQVLPSGCSRSLPIGSLRYTTGQIFG